MYMYNCTCILCVCMFMRVCVYDHKRICEINKISPTFYIRINKSLVNTILELHVLQYMYMCIAVHVHVYCSTCTCVL